MSGEDLGVTLRKVEFVQSASGPRSLPAPSLPEVAFAGRSNVGKSSLINALTGRRSLVKVSSTPGRTQLINFFNINDALLLVDLPGYGFAKVPPAIKQSWGKMIESYLTDREPLKAMVVIMDLRRGVEDDDLQLIQSLPYYGIQPILVFTKADKYARNARMQRRREIAQQTGWPAEELLLVSSLHRTGLPELWKLICDLTHVELT
jgi:GTP-binding protein